MRILLILPCMSWVSYKGDYTKGKLWKKVLDTIKATPHQVDVYAIDCIRLQSDGQMIGVWSPSKERKIFDEILKNKLDNYPAWGKYKHKPELRDELKGRVRKKISSLRNRYDKIISFTNVKVYHFCLQELAEEFDIVTLPRNVNWKAPRSVPFKNINELVEQLSVIEKEVVA